MVPIKHEEYRTLMGTKRSQAHIPMLPFAQDRQAVPMDLCILPGIAFDKQGSRIGYGKGHYDRYLVEHLRQFSRLPFLVAVCHDEQYLGYQVAMESHDIPTNAIVTPTRVLIMNP